MDRPGAPPITWVHLEIPRPQVHLEIPRRTWQVRFFEKKHTTPGAPGDLQVHLPGGTNATTGAPFAIAFGVKARL
jgi:hypothetical protein